MTLLRAAPGKYPELLAEVRRQIRAVTGADTGSPTPTRGLALRHSQGDQWDFLVLVQTGAAGAGSTAIASIAAAPFPDALVAWQEDELVRGPALDKLPGFLEMGLYHLEMFDAAPGKLDELVREREMENAYGAALGRPGNLIFRREFGAAWDAFTIDAYRNWTHYAERDQTKPEASLAAAKAAGFESDQAIGAYMRSLLISHHDTLASAIR
jgi:hypothetical protein